MNAIIVHLLPILYYEQCVYKGNTLFQENPHNIPVPTHPNPPPSPNTWQTLDRMVQDILTYLSDAVVT